MVFPGTPGFGTPGFPGGDPFRGPEAFSPYAAAPAGAEDPDEVDLGEAGFGAPTEPPPPLDELYPPPDTVGRGPLAEAALQEPRLFLLGPTQLEMVRDIVGDAHGPNLSPSRAAFLSRHGVVLSEDHRHAAHDMGRAHNVALDTLSVHTAQALAQRVEEELLGSAASRLYDRLRLAQAHGQAVPPETVKRLQIGEAWQARRAALAQSQTFMEQPAGARAALLQPEEARLQADYTKWFMETHGKQLIEQGVLLPHDVQLGMEGLMAAFRRAQTQQALDSMDPRSQVPPRDQVHAANQTAVEQTGTLLGEFMTGLDEIVYAPLLDRLEAHMRGDLVAGVHPDVPAPPPPDWATHPTADLDLLPVLPAGPAKANPPPEAGKAGADAEAPEADTILTWQLYVLSRIGGSANVAALTDTLVSENPDLMGGDETTLRAYINDTLEQLVAKGYVGITHNDDRGNVTITVTDEGSAQAAAFAGRVELMDAIEYAASRLIFTRQNLMDDLGLDEADANDRLARLIEQGVIEEYDNGYYLLVARESS